MGTEQAGHRTDRIERPQDVTFSEPRKGQRAAWEIRLTGLAPPQHLCSTSAPEGASVQRLTSAGSGGESGASPHGEPDSATAQPPHLARARDKTRQDKTVNLRDAAENAATPYPGFRECFDNLLSQDDWWETQ
jgi:hypothetical protein